MADRNQNFAATVNQPRDFSLHQKIGLTLPVHFWSAALKWAVILVGAKGIIYVLVRLHAERDEPRRMAA